MDHAEIDLLIQEATKNYVDHSLGNVHGKLQDALTSEHRSSYDSYSYGDYPQVHHVFGDKDSGQVVYKQGDSHFRAPYKMDNGGYSLGSSEGVQLAYVPAHADVSESIAHMLPTLSPKDLVKIDTIMERYISTTERKTMSEEDFAGKGKSFPIAKPEDVRAALDSIGRAGGGNHSPAELKSRILAIAKRKGFAVPKSDKDEKKESAREVEETAVFEEAAIDTEGNAEVLLMSPGTGSMGHYSENVLKEAAKNKVFASGTRMFLDHQTVEERRARPEGDTKKWAATTTSDAEYKENGKEGPGLYAKTRIYKDFVPFIKERAKDIGVSVRAGIVPSGKTVNGVPEVKEMKYALSADFVTRAGRGGKVVEMYESFRQAAGTRSEESMTDQEKAQFTLLQESVAKQGVSLDRLREENDKLKAASLVAESLQGTGLPIRGMKRVTAIVMASLPYKDGALDVEKFQEAVKAAVTDEIGYLQEAGVKVSPFAVRNAGGAIPPVDTAVEDAKLLQESSATFGTSIDSIMGRKPKKEVTTAA